MSANVMNRKLYNVTLPGGTTDVVEAEAHLLSHGTLQFHNHEFGGFTLVVAYGVGGWHKVEAVLPQHVRDTRLLGKAGDPSTQESSWP